MASSESWHLFLKDIERRPTVYLGRYRDAYRKRFGSETTYVE